MMNREVKAITSLLVAGAIGGFFLSSGSAKYFKPKPAMVARQEEPAETQEASQSGKKARKPVGREQEEGKSAAAGAPDTAKKPAGKGDKKEKPGNEEPDTGEVDKPKSAGNGSTTLTGDQALQFLAGNTIKIMRDERAIYRYMSGRGWQGEKDGLESIVHRWMWKSNKLCEITSQGVYDCEPVEIHTEPEPKPGAGVVLGMVVIGTAPQRQVLRGNVAGVPERIPLLDGSGKAPREREPKTPSGTGHDALTALLDRNLLSDAGVPNRLAASYYQTGGIWIESRPLVHDDAAGTHGVSVRVGRWDFANGQFCQEAPSLELTRECFQPEQWGATTFRLRPTGSNPARTLTVMADAATQ